VKKAGRAAAALLVFLVSAGPFPGTAAGQATSSVPKLTARQRAERIRDLPEDERRWLTDYIAPIILPDERDLFLQLPEPYQREAFKVDFWKRRERDGLHPPFGPGYQLRYGHLREVAAEEYDGVDSDAGRMVVRLGEPTSIESLSDCSEVFRDAEIWDYPTPSGSGFSVHLFYRPSFGGPRRLWLPGDTGIFQTSSCIASFDQACGMAAGGLPSLSSSTGCPGNAIPKTCSSACRVARAASDIQFRGMSEGGSIAAAPPVSTEGLDGLWSRYASLPATGAKPIAVEVPGRVKTVAPPEETPVAAGGTPSEDIEQRIQALPKKYREWLDLAGPLLSLPELVEFLHLPPSGRDAYIRKFWKRNAHTR